MKFYPTLEETLTKRFTDSDEISDISNHGITGGFHGFIYTYELTEFFDRYEDEICDELENYFGEDYLKQLSEEAFSFDNMKEKAVWIVAESWCHMKAEGF